MMQMVSGRNDRASPSAHAWERRPQPCRQARDRAGSSRGSSEPPPLSSFLALESCAWRAPSPTSCATRSPANTPIATVSALSDSTGLVVADTFTHKTLLTSSRPGGDAPPMLRRGEHYDLGRTPTTHTPGAPAGARART